MGGIPIEAKLIEYLVRHPREYLQADHVATTLGETSDRVKNGMGHLLRRRKMEGLSRFAPAVWRYEPPDGKIEPLIKVEPETKPDSKPIPKGKIEPMFIQIALLDDGTPLVMSEEGRVFKLVKLI